MCGDTLHTGLEGKSPKEKTAMMMLIEWVDKNSQQDFMNPERIHRYALELLATEREDIIYAHIAGQKFDDDNDNPDSEEYYQTKYGETPELLTPKTETNG